MMNPDDSILSYKNEHTSYLATKHVRVNTSLTQVYETGNDQEILRVIRNCKYSAAVQR